MPRSPILSSFLIWTHCFLMVLLHTMLHGHVTVQSFPLGHYYGWNPKILLLVAAMPSLRFLELRRFTSKRAWGSLRCSDPAVALPKTLVSLTLMHPEILHRYALNSILRFCRHLTRLRKTLIETCKALEGFMLYYVDGLW